MPHSSTSHPAWLGIGRAIGGALVFSLPMMMTMEMWQEGFVVEPLRLLLLILLTFPLWVGVSSIVGFEHTKTLRDDVLDVLVAYAIGFLASTVMLCIFGVVTASVGPGETFSMLLLQSVPASLGALLARSLIGKNEEIKQDPGYRNELITLMTGSLYLAFNVAPTEEIILISYKMQSVHLALLVLLTLIVMQMFTVSDVNVSTDSLNHWRSHWDLFVRFTSPGYMLAFVVSFFMLWVLGHTDGDSTENMINSALVLSLPAGIGAAAARLIV